MCDKIVSRLSLNPDESVWMSKLHGETLALVKNPRKKVSSSPTGKGFFADRFCEFNSLCEKWIPPERIEQLKMEEAVEAVFY